jgi:quercetin dioxygenase-like cupin family protein
VHFSPGARTAWHTHSNGQTIYVTEGLGLCQRRGGPVEVIRPGDRVFFEPGEDHWHGAAPDRFMTHLAMLEVDGEGASATWGDQVSDAEYGAALGAAIGSK